MKTKFNSTNLPFVAMITTCLMAMMLMFAGFSINANAADAPGFNTVTNGTTVSFKVVQSNSQLVQKQVIHVITATKTTDGAYTINPGVYYVNESGYIANLPSATMVISCSDFANNTLTASTQRLVKQGSFSIINGYVGSALSYYAGTYTDGKVYYNGVYYGNGQNTYYYDGAAFYVLNNGTKGSAANGVITGIYYDATTNTFKSIDPNGYYVSSGKAATAVVNLKYYKNGAFASTTTGWLTLSSKIYYVKNGVAVTGWNKLKSYGQGVKSYKYLFNKNGVMYTDLISYYGYSKFIQKDIKIICNKTTHNLTFYIKSGSDYIPAKTVICATARKKGDTPNGTFRLEKTWHKRWFVYTKTNGAPYRYYQWAVHIKGTPTLIHSSTYKKAKATSLRTDLYNKLGTSCTTHCIRIQARYAKMVYDISTKTYKKRRVPVQIITSKNEGPFGHVGLTKVSSKTKWDPTDPNKK